MTTPRLTDTVDTSYAQTAAAALRCLAHDAGVVLVRGRTRTGVGESEYAVAPADLVDGLPTRLLQELLDGFTQRASIAVQRRSDRAFVALGVLVARWALPYEATEAGLELDAAAVERVDAALASMPPPSLLTVAGAEVAACWRLHEPITDAAEAAAQLARLAERLGATPLDDLTAADVPIAGPVRNWRTTPPDAIDVRLAEPDRRYTLTDLFPETSHAHDALESAAPSAPASRARRADGTARAGRV